jgi:hypothetical protein
MSLQEALTIVRDAGFRVSKPKARTSKSTLNAIGKPYSPQFDPKYRIKHRTPRLPRTQNIDAAITPEQWTIMCKIAKKQWDHVMQKGGSFPLHMGRE